MIAENTDVERRIEAAIAAIIAHGYTLHFVEWCEDAETPGIIGMYAMAEILERADRRARAGAS